MRMRLAVVLLLLSAWLSAQETKPPCPADWPVDDLVAEITKKQARNKNPLPQNICILRWCARTRPEPEPQSLPKISGQLSDQPDQKAGDESSSVSPKQQCEFRMQPALQAAKNVEVGDYYFGEKNYRAALMRYQDAQADKPNDAAIHVRLGRAYEKLNEPDKARGHYEQAVKLGAPAKWVEEAQRSFVRLRNAWLRELINRRYKQMASADEVGGRGAKEFGAVGQGRVLGEEPEGPSASNSPFHL